ncbi:hypothetical protein DL98DRAFT_597381 [Cadophora sp. DSE1049]|nr:hypothetical protein DL98DRAFT_597381 [Cadophora sp. DSE1049]
MPTDQQRPRRPQRPRGPNEPVKETQFNAGSRRERLEFLRILKGWTEEYRGLQVSEYVPLDVLEPGKLPDQWLRNERYPYRSFQEQLDSSRINMENPLGQRARFTESSIPRPGAKTGNTTWMKKLEAVRFIVKGHLELDNCLSLLPENLQTNRDNPSMNEYAAEIYKIVGESVNKMVPTVGMALLIFILRQENFLEMPLCPFHTDTEQAKFFLKIIRKNEIIVPGFIQRVLPAVNLLFLYGNGTYPDSTIRLHGIDFNALKRKLRTNFEYKVS